MEKLKKYIEEKFEINKNMLESPYFKKIEKIYGKDEAKKQLEFLCSLSKHNLEDIPTITNWIRKQKYYSRHARLLGSKSKAMPDNIFKKLLNACDNERIKLLIEYDGFEGPRPHDAVMLRTDDLNFNEHTVTIFNSKLKRYYTLPLDTKVEKHLFEFIKNHKKEIEDHNHYIFFSLNNRRQTEHMSDRYVKNYIVEKLDELGLNKKYAESKDGRTLWLYGFHSIRGHAITNAYNNSNHNMKVAAEVADHSPKSMEVTALYIADDEKELRKAI